MSRRVPLLAVYDVVHALEGAYQAWEADGFRSWGVVVPAHEAPFIIAGTDWLAALKHVYRYADQCCGIPAPFLAVAPGSTGKAPWIGVECPTAAVKAHPERHRRNRAAEALIDAVADGRPVDPAPELAGTVAFHLTGSDNPICHTDAIAGLRAASAAHSA